MKHLAILAFQALLAANTVSAQEVAATVNIYNKKTCGEDANDPDLVSLTFDVLEETGVSHDKDDYKCMYAQVDVDGWPQTEGYYDVWIDEDGIEGDCELVFFDGASDGDSSGLCWKFLRRVQPDGKCTSLRFSAAQFGYSMCCGDACEVSYKDFPTTEPDTASKRSLPTSAPKPVRDVTQVKRTPPFDRLQRRDTCEFESDSDETTIEWGEQTRVTKEQSCVSAKACNQEVTVTWEQSYTNSFSAGAELGGTLFEAIGVSVNFQNEYSEEKGTSFEESYKFDMPAGSKGYVTFMPKMECSPEGKFTGDCKWETDKDGKACFPIFVQDKPDGSFDFVQTD